MNNGIKVKDLKVGIIYKDRLSEDRVLVHDITEQVANIPEGETIKTWTANCSRYDRMTGGIDSFFMAYDDQLTYLR